MRRLPSVVFITSTVLASAAALSPTPAAAGVVAATPDSVANTSDPAALSFDVGTTEALKLVLNGTKVTLTGPTEIPSAEATFTAVSQTPNALSGTVAASFDLDPGGTALPVRPGTYDAAIFAGNSATSDDTSTVTVTNNQPALSASVTLPAGETDVPLTVTANPGVDPNSAHFAAGDIMSFTHNGEVVDGLSLSDPDLEATTFGGNLSAAKGVTPGDYDITVTDTAGGIATCAGCITVAPGTGVVTDLTASSVTHTSASLHWSAPTTGPQPPTGYNVFVSADPAPTSTPTGITVAHSGTDLIATVTGLTAGVRYYVSVVTTTIAGPGDAAPLTFFTGEASTLTITNTGLHLKFGQRLTLSGRLGSASASLPNESVVLYSKVGTAAAHALKTVQTDGTGNYNYTFAPAHSATYFAAFLGSAGTATGPAIDPAQSRRVQGTVAQKITLIGAAVHHFKWLQLTGKVVPSAAGRTVVIYNKKHGHLNKYVSAKLSPTSTYKVVLKHVKSGRYKLYAKIAATSTNLAGTSKVLPVLKP